MANSFRHDPRSELAPAAETFEARPNRLVLLGPILVQKCFLHFIFRWRTGWKGQRGPRGKLPSTKRKQSGEPFCKWLPNNGQRACLGTMPCGWRATRQSELRRSREREAIKIVNQYSSCDKINVIRSNIPFLFFLPTFLVAFCGSCEKIGKPSIWPLNHACVRSAFDPESPSLRGCCCCCC